MFAKRLGAAASLALLISCSDSTGTVVIPGVVTFTYSGGISGTYSATGNLPTSNSAQETTQWSAGAVDASDGSVYVISASPRSATTHDYVALDIGRTTAGSANVSNSSCTSACTGFYVTFGQENGSGATNLQTCFIETGTFTITEITSTRIKGTFSGTGTCFAFSGTTTAFTVTNGTFDSQVLPSF